VHVVTEPNQPEIAITVASDKKKRNYLRYIILCLGPFLLWLAIQLPAIAGLSQPAYITLGILAWMVLWWTFEVIPLAATSLLPLLLLPLTGVSDAATAATPYANPLIFLFFGGFVLSLAIENVGLHRQFAQRALKLAGESLRAQLGIIMGITAFLSMWMSNTATAVMMLPIVLAILKNYAVTHPLSPHATAAMLLGVAYAANIGGIATLIGTAPNVLMAAFLKQNHGINIAFFDWMLLGVPIAGSTLIVSWLFLARHLPAMPNNQIDKIPHCANEPLTHSQRKVGLVFMCTVIAWILQQPLSQWLGLKLTDTGIAIMAAITLFSLRDDDQQPLLPWSATSQLPWGVLLLFGAGLTMAEQIQATGVAGYIAEQFSHTSHLEPFFIVVFVTVVIIFLTEISSNTATAAAFLPLLGPVAVAMQLPAWFLVIPACLAASYAFMLPIATPPNAIVFASGQLTIRQMAKEGFWLNILGTVVISVGVYFLAPSIFK
jgi:sodium-dependent dicarboxylate transporter 2/3/5